LQEDGYDDEGYSAEGQINPEDPPLEIVSSLLLEDYV